MQAIRVFLQVCTPHHTLLRSLGSIRTPLSADHYSYPQSTTLHYTTIQYTTLHYTVVPLEPLWLPTGSIHCQCQGYRRYRLYYRPDMLQPIYSIIHCFIQCNNSILSLILKKFSNYFHYLLFYQVTIFYVKIQT